MTSPARLTWMLLLVSVIDSALSSYIAVESCPHGEACVFPYQCTVVDERVLTPRIQIRPEPAQGRSQCATGKICCKNPSHQCGRNTKEIAKMIVSDSDHEAKPGNFPWQLALLKKVPGYYDRQLLGGASLVHRQAVVTAAHKVYNLTNGESLVIRLSQVKLANTNYWDHQKDIAVSQIHIHEHFNTNSFANNIAVLILDHAAVLGGLTGTICLPPPTGAHWADGHSTKLNMNQCLVAGWGRSSFSQQRLQSTLRFAQQEHVPAAVCEKVLSCTLDKGAWFRLHKSERCAYGVGGSDACCGDGGSPLICPTLDRQRYYQIGITSRGLGCGEFGIPGIYTDLTQYHGWILEKIHNNRIL